MTVTIFTVLTYFAIWGFLRVRQVKIPAVSDKDCSSSEQEKVFRECVGSILNWAVAAQGWF